MKEVDRLRAGATKGTAALIAAAVTSAAVGWEYGLAHGIIVYGLMTWLHMFWSFR